MTAKKRKTLKPIEFVLDETIDLSSITRFYDQLNKLLGTSKPVIINSCQVKKIDTAAVQLISIWFSSATRNNIDVKWKNIDGVFFNTVKKLGLTKFLALE